MAGDDHELDSALLILAGAFERDMCDGRKREKFPHGEWRDKNSTRNHIRNVDAQGRNKPMSHRQLTRLPPPHHP